MRKNLLKTFVIVNTIALGLVGSLGTNSSSALTKPDFPMYSNGQRIEYAGKDSFYFNDYTDTIDINLGNSAYYDVYLGDAIALNNVTGWVRGLDVSRLREGSHTLEIRKHGSDTALYEYLVVVDQTAPSYRADIDTDLGKEDYNGRGSVYIEISNAEYGSDVDHLEVAYRRGTEYITIDVLDPDETRFKLSSGDMRQIGEDNPRIYLFAVDAAGNKEEIDYVKINTDYRDKDNKNTDYSYLFPQLMPETVSFTGTTNISNQTINFKASEQYPVYVAGFSKITVDFPTDAGVTYYLNSDYSSDPLTPNVTDVKDKMSNGNLTIYYKDAHGNKDYTTIRYEQAKKVSALTGKVSSLSIDSNGDLKETTTTLTSPVSGFVKDTISFDADVAYYSIGSSSYSKGNVNDLNKAIREKGAGTYTINVVTTSGQTISFSSLKIGNETVKPFDTTPTITIGEDKNPQVGYTVDIDVALNAAPAYDVYKIIVNDRVIKTIKASDIKDNKFSAEYRTTGADKLKLDVKVLAYDKSDSNILMYEATESATIREKDLIYGIIDYSYATQDSITVSATLVDPRNNLDDARLALYNRNDLIEEVRIKPGTTIYTFENLDVAATYEIKIEGEKGREYKYGDRESVLNSKYVGGDEYDECPIPYTSDISFSTLGNSDLVKIYDYDVKFDAEDNELILNLSYEVLGEGGSKSLSVDAYVYDTVDGRYDRFRSRDFKDDSISVKTTPGKGLASIVLRPEVEDHVLSADKFYRFEVSDGATTLFTANFYPENSKPDYTIETKALGETNAEFYVTFEENDSRIGRATLYVYEARYDDYEDYDYKQDVSKDKQTVKVNGLRKNTEYIVEVRADYTTNGGVSITNDLISRMSFVTGKTNPVVKLNNVVSSGSNIYFDYQIDDLGDNVINARAQLYSNGKKLDGKYVTLYPDTDVTRESFSGIDSDKEYEIKIELEYKSNINGEVIKNDNYTNPDGTSTNVKVYASKLIPVAEANIDLSFDKITVDINLKDENGSLQYSPARPTVKLYEVGKSAPVAQKTIDKGDNHIVFDKLDEDTEYSVRVDVFYRPSQNAKNQSVTLFSQDVKTLKQVDAKFTDVKSNSDAITLSIFVTNNKAYDIFAEIKAGDQVLNKTKLNIGANKVSFTGLEANKTYEVIAYSVDKEGNRVDLTKDSFKSIPETIVTKPTFEIVKVNPDGKTLNITLNVSDPDEVIKPQAVNVVIKDANGVEKDVVKKVALREIYDNNSTLIINLPYEKNSIKVSVNYENADQKTVEISQSVEYTVDASEGPSIVTYAVIGVLGVTVIAMAGVLIYRKRR